MEPEGKRSKVIPQSSDSSAQSTSEACRTTSSTIPTPAGVGTQVVPWQEHHTQEETQLTTVENGSASTSTASSKQKMLPEDYTFLNPWIMISKKAKDIYEGLEKDAEARDPDAHGMYLYNGLYLFFFYSPLLLVLLSISRYGLSG